MGFRYRSPVRPPQPFSSFSIRLLDGVGGGDRWKFVAPYVRKAAAGSTRDALQDGPAQASTAIVKSSAADTA